METENSLEDILETAGYTEIEPEEVRTVELEEGISEYSGYYGHSGEYRGVGLYRTIKLMQEKESIEALTRAVSELKPETIVELGTARGGTLYLWSRFFDKAELIVSVDRNHRGKERLFREFAPDKEMVFVEGNTHENRTYEAVADSIGGQGIDFLYIDADHSYEGVKNDFETYRSLVREDGVIGLHDVSHPGTGVPEFWCELKEDYSTSEFGQATVKNGLVYL